MPLEIIRFFCIKCGKKIKVDAKFIGKNGNCPACQTEFTVPEPSNTESDPTGSNLLTCTQCKRKSPPNTVYCSRCGACLEPKQIVQPEDITAVNPVTDFHAKSSSAIPGVMLPSVVPEPIAAVPAQVVPILPNGSARSARAGNLAPQNKPLHKKCGTAAIVGAIILGISLPMKWEIFYADTESFGFGGCMLFLEVVAILLLAIGQLASTDAEKAKPLAKHIAGLGGFAFLFAAYTILSISAVGEQSIGGIRGGARTGPGVWLGAFGAVIVIFSQMAILANTDSEKEVSGVDSIAPAGVAGVAGGKTTFDVVLTAVGNRKIQVIKALRNATGLGLREAKDLIESAPKTIRENMSREHAEKLKKILEDQGATVEVK